MAKNSADSIPLPTRPGTVCEWNTELRARGSLICVHCGKGADGHGAPEDIALTFNVPLNRRHLICPAPDEAWEEYNAARRRCNIDDFVAYFVRELQKLPPTERHFALTRVMASVDG